MIWKKWQKILFKYKHDYFQHDNQLCFDITKEVINEIIEHTQLEPYKMWSWGNSREFGISTAWRVNTKQIVIGVDNTFGLYIIVRYTSKPSWYISLSDPLCFQKLKEEIGRICGDK